MAVLIKEDTVNQFASAALGAAKIGTLMAEKKRLQAANQLAEQGVKTAQLERQLKQQEGLKDLIAQFNDPFDTEVTDQEANDVIELMTPELKKRGVPLEEINKGMIRNLIQSHARQTRKENQQIQSRNDAIAISQLSAAGSRADPATIMEIGVSGNNMTNLDDRRSVLLGRLSAKGERPEEGTEAEVYDRQIAGIKREIIAVENERAVESLKMADLRRRQIGVQKQSNVEDLMKQNPRNPEAKALDAPESAAERDKRRVFVTNQEQYDRLDPDTPVAYVLPDGSIYKGTKE